MGTEINLREIRTLNELADTPTSNKVLVVYGVIERSLLEKISLDFLSKYSEQESKLTVIYLLEILNESPSKEKEVRIFLEQMVEDPDVSIVHCVCFEEEDENIQSSIYLSCICLGMMATMHAQTLIKLCVLHTENQTSLIKLLLVPVKMNLTEFVIISSDKEEIVRRIISLFRFKEQEYKTHVQNELNQISQNSIEEVPDMSQSGD